jgi:hypothetical protein
MDSNAYRVPATVCLPQPFIHSITIRSLNEFAPPKVRAAEQKVGVICSAASRESLSSRLVNSFRPGATMVYQSSWSCV